MTTFEVSGSDITIVGTSAYGVLYQLKTREQPVQDDIVIVGGVRYEVAFVHKNGFQLGELVGE